MTRAAAQVGLILLTALALFLAFAWQPAGAAGGKWFVCKYTTTPGGEEVLQTGQNPISVSENAIPVSPVVVGTTFSDAQGRSLVIEEDIGQAEPAAECPDHPAQPYPVAQPYGDALGYAFAIALAFAIAVGLTDAQPDPNLIAARRRFVQRRNLPRDR